MADSRARPLAIPGQFPAIGQSLGIDHNAGRLSSFWRTHALWPLGALALVFILIEALGLDLKVTNALFYDHVTRQWLGAGAGDWWAHRLLHDDGRWVVRGVAALALGAWCLTFFVPSIRHWRRSAGFIVIAMAASTLLVGGLKLVTNVDCPWDLSEYGGAHPYFPLFSDRPDYLPRAQCFPGAHSSSAFALVCFYFVLRERRPRLAWLALGVACLAGTAFAVGQEARGAHFLSHDLASAMLVWAIQLYLYARVLGLPAVPAAVSPAAGAAAASQA